jgi:hypothetical protein
VVGELEDVWEWNEDISELVVALDDVCCGGG